MFSGAPASIFYIGSTGPNFENGLRVSTLELGADNLQLFRRASYEIAVARPTLTSQPLPANGGSIFSLVPKGAEDYNNQFRVYLTDAVADVANTEYMAIGDIYAKDANKFQIMALKEGTGTVRSIQLMTIDGISNTELPARNLRGQVTLASGTATVTFDEAEATADYYITLGIEASAVGANTDAVGWTNKTTAGFTINCSDNTSTAKVDWILIR